MSSAYSGEAVPLGVAADAFYPKSAISTGSLFKMVDALIEQGRSHRSRSEAPIWIHPFSIDSHPESAHLVWCPECLRMFSQCAEPPPAELNSAHCPHCSCDMLFALLTFSSEPHHSYLDGLQGRPLSGMQAMR